MPASKPTLGYPSRTAAVLALRARGYSRGKVAALIGIPDTTVAALEVSGRRAGKRRQRPAEQNGRTIVFPRDVLDRLHPHAAERDITANELARRIVETVLDEGLIRAVLDDGEEEKAA